MRGHASIVDVFIQRNVPLQTTNKFGKSALDLVSE